MRKNITITPVKRNGCFLPNGVPFFPVFNRATNALCKGNLKLFCLLLYCTYIHKYIHTHLYTHIHTINIHAYYLHTYIHAYIHTYMHTYIHTYIHICTYTYILFTYIRYTYRVVYTVHTYMPTNNTGLDPFLKQAHLPQSHIMSRHAAVKKDRVRLLYVQPHQVLHHHHHVAQGQLATLRPQGVLSEWSPPPALLPLALPCGRRPRRRAVRGS